jgi:hypothetical protein
MNNIIEDNGEDQFANGQSSRTLRVSSDATEPPIQLDAVTVLEQYPDVAPEEFSAPENWEREWQRCGSQFLPEQIDADERLSGYLREPHLPRFESRSARNFGKQRVHRGDPLSVLLPSQSNDDQSRKTSESDAANTDAISPRLNAIC